MSPHEVSRAQDEVWTIMRSNLSTQGDCE